MPPDATKPNDSRTRLYVYNGGFLTQSRVRRILDLAGWDVRIGAPGDSDWVGVWGKSPTAPRGEAVAAMRDKPILRVEDAFLRSLFPGRDKEPPMGLCLDRRGVHFDPSIPSDLEHLLATHPLDDTGLLDRARHGAERLKYAHLSKYAATDPDHPLPDPGYVLVIDQTEGDASVTASGANRSVFVDMLVTAQLEFPGSPVLIKSHPETTAGHRPGYFNAQDKNDQISFFDGPASPWALMENAVAVYTVSSGLGFEAIYAGHKPHVFGQPFYAGWGLTNDRNPVARRERKLTRAQLFAAAMILYPAWYDPYRDRLCALEDVISNLEAQARCWREDRQGWVAASMSRWKHPHLSQFFGRYETLEFQTSSDDARTSAVSGRRPMAWASKAEGAITRVEDGFLRSRGLGAELVPPLSLVLDDVGISYDPTQPSRLEELISDSLDLPDGEVRRAEELIKTLRQKRITKYNPHAAPFPDLPDGPVILVPGQVEDDASILKGAGEIKTNTGLLAAVRAENPEATILYKPHPDVIAGLRGGAADTGDADIVLGSDDPADLLDRVSSVWTMTSGLGFEALLREVPVVTFGAPFFAGWGLTDDRGAIPPRRVARPSLAGLAHACLIGYPRYFDPVTQMPCPVEVAVDRLAEGDIPTLPRRNRVLSRLQGLFPGLVKRLR